MPTRPARLQAELTLERENSTYRVYEGSFDPLIAGSDDDTPITFEYYEQIGTDMAPVVLVLPILNGQKHVVRPFATYFAENGYNAVIVDTVQRKTLLEDMLQPEEAIRRTTIRHRRVLDWIDTVPNIDKSKVAVFGASLGGFNALFVTAADERISASALALVAGDLPFVLTNSSEGRIIDAADGAMETLQTDKDGLRRYLEENIQSDPLSLARHIDPERVLLVLAKFDDAVHYEKQLELQRAMGNPESITLPTGHVTTAAYLFYLRSSVLEFFDRKLDGPAPPEPVAAEPEATDDDLLARPAVEAPFTGAPVTAAEHAPLLDRTQQTVENVVTGTARVVDNMFGSADVEEEASVTRGRLSVGGQWDQRDGLRERIRLKARFGLPALNQRTSLLLGRGDVSDFVDGSADDNIDTLPDRFNDFEDEDWLLGIGYSRDATLRRGWSFGAGVRVKTPLEPFVRATYRWHKVFGDDWLWRVEPRLFLQNQRGAGISIQNTLDHVLTDSWLLRSWSIVVAEEEVEGMAWTTKLVAYNNLSDKTAMSYAIYSTGETDYEVPVRDYGIELRYRRQISREWLFIELLTFMNWPRDFLVEERERNIGIGIEFEMQFGEWPGRPPQKQQ